MPETDDPHRNEIVLVGRLSGLPETRELPSGDQITTFRLVVRRSPSPRERRAGVRAPSVDTLDCVAWRADVQRLAGGWVEGDLLECHGSLRRRFWRGAAGGPASRTEVEAVRVRRLRRADAIR